MSKIKGSRNISFSIPLIIIVFLVLILFSFPQNLLISRILSQEITSIQNENIRKITQSMKESLVLELEANEFILRGYGMGLSGEKQVLQNIKEGTSESSINYANNAVSRVKESNPHFEAVFIADREGKIIVSTSDSLLGEDIGEKDYFQAILLVGNNIYTSPKPMVSMSTGANIIVQATSIAQGGEIIGLLGASLNLDRMGHELILSKKLGETGEPFVLDREGHYLISSNESLLMTRAQDQDPLYQMILDSPLSSQTTTVTVGGETYHASFERYPGLYWTVGLTMAEKELYQSVYTIRRMMILLTAVLIIAVSLILFFYVRLRLVKKILSVEDLISQASRGDLTERGHLKGHDEITGMAENFNGLLNSLSSFFAHLNDSMENLDAVGYDLSSHMEETAAAVYQIKTNVENSQSQISKQEESVNSTVSTVEQISRSIESLERNIELQNQNIEQGSAGVEEMIGQIKSVSASMKTAEELMNVLSRSSDDGQENVKAVTGLVGEIADKSHELEEANALISGIASQTNLLAMNAAIEAAHAGDAGRGFAVVADEIRKLAEQSSTQSKQVKSTISQINNMITKVVEGSRNSNESFDRIHVNIEEMNRITGEMTLSMAEQVTGSEQVLSSLGQLKDSGLEVSRGSHEMTRGNEVILQSVEELSHISREVSQAMTEISTGIEEINHSVDSVSEITRKNTDNISAVREEAGFFKLEGAPEDSEEMPLDCEPDSPAIDISPEPGNEIPEPLKLSDNDQVTDLEPEEEL